MHRVVVRFDKAQEKKSLKLTGWAEELPREGRAFHIKVQQEGYPTFQVDFGRVVNIHRYGNLLLVQTDNVVLEVHIQVEESGNPIKDNVLPFLRPGQLQLKDGKFRGRKRRNNLVYDWHLERGFNV